MAQRPRALFLQTVLTLLVLLLITSCGSEKKSLAPRTQTFGEIRAIRGAVTVAPPGEPYRAILPGERLTDGTAIEVPADALAWLRRDGGSTLLVRGPAKLELGAQATEVTQGRVFVDSPGDEVTAIRVPEGLLHLVRVRASLEVPGEGERSEAYVLSGEVRTSGGTRAGPGERLVLAQKEGNASVEPAVAWVDWTGGLATTDRGSEPAPFGVGTVGARLPGEQGAPRTPLVIRRMQVRVTIEGDLATTEVDQLFFNGASETVEGLYSFRTPIGAALTRFGVDRDGVLVWGRVKEKKAAAKQYESHVYRGSKEDPALLEWDAPGVYSARLYPIAAGATRRVVVRYTEWLQRTGEQGQRRLYTFPMAAEGSEASLPHIEFFNAIFDLSRAGAKEVRTGMRGSREEDKVVVRAHDLVPRADLAVELFDEGVTAIHAYRATHGVDEALVAPEDRAEARRRARAEPDYVLIPIRASDIPRREGGLDLVIVVDTSAAMDDASLAIARAAVGALLSHLGEQDRALVWAGDAILRPVAQGWTELRAVNEKVRRDAAVGLATLHRGGATDLGATLSQAAASLDPARRGAMVYIGDGRPTVGELALSDLRERMSKLPQPVRTFGLGVGQDADMAIIEGLAHAGFAQRIGDAAVAARSALRVLEMAERPAWLGVQVDLGPTVERLVPRNLETLVADESVLMVGRLTGEMPDSVRITTPAGQKTLRVLPQRVDDNGDLQARWAGGRLRQLLADGLGRAALVDLGVRTGIITPFTSLYVPTKGEMSPSELEELRRQQREGSDRGVRRTGSQDVRFALADLPLFFSGCSKLNLAADKEEPAEESLPGDQAPAAPAPVAAAPRAAREPTLEPELEVNEEKAKEAPTRTNTKARTAERDELAEPMEQDDSVSADPRSAQKKLRGDSVSDEPAADSLDLPGTGEGFGSGHGRLGGAHRVQPPRVRMGQTTVNGSLPPEVIQRIVRQNFGRFRLCYEQGLRNNPNLRGKVTVRFLIGRDGTVSNVTDAGSDLADPSVVSCVTRTYRGLSFPQPEGGLVTVVYPILFTPGDVANQPEHGAPASGSSVHVTVLIGKLPHDLVPCDPGSTLPFAERVELWRERLAKAGGDPSQVKQVYFGAIESCEAPTWRGRAKLQSMMLDALPTVTKRVHLWRMMQAHKAVADALYRGVLARVRKPAEMRELHQALGLKSVDPGVLEDLLDKTKDPGARVEKLRALRVQWPNDFTLALRLLEALEDAGDDGGARALGRALRDRPDANAHVLTEVGELYLRLAKRADAKQQAAEDEAEARRTFGEIVEFAPDEPIARRRLGDLLRAHGWFSEAARQYETLARLSPDDTGLLLLHAAAAQGLGKLDEAVRWAEKVSSDGAPGNAQGLARTARALAGVYLAWGRVQAAADGNSEELALLRSRTENLLDQDDRSAGSVRAVLLWSHPELHPTLWSNALGSMMPAPEGDVTLGISQVILPRRDGAQLEVRMAKHDAAHAARLGAQAVLTVIFNEGRKDEKVVKLPVAFSRGGPATLQFTIKGTEVQP